MALVRNAMLYAAAKQEAINYGSYWTLYKKIQESPNGKLKLLEGVLCVVSVKLASLVAIDEESGQLLGPLCPSGNCQGASGGGAICACLEREIDRMDHARNTKLTFADPLQVNEEMLGGLVDPGKSEEEEHTVKESILDVLQRGVIHGHGLIVARYTEFGNTIFIIGSNDKFPICEYNLCFEPGTCFNGKGYQCEKHFVNEFCPESAETSRKLMLLAFVELAESIFEDATIQIDLEFRWIAVLVFLYGMGGSFDFRKANPSTPDGHNVHEYITRLMFGDDKRLRYHWITSISSKYSRELCISPYCLKHVEHIGENKKDQKAEKCDDVDDEDMDELDHEDPCPAPENDDKKRRCKIHRRCIDRQQEQRILQIIEELGIKKGELRHVNNAREIIRDRIIKFIIEEDSSGRILHFMETESGSETMSADDISVGQDQSIVSDATVEVVGIGEFEENEQNDPIFNVASHYSQ